MLSGAVSSAGQSASPTPRMSGVRVPHRPPRYGPDRAGRGRELLLTAAIGALLGAALFVACWVSQPAHASGDTFWYTRQAYMLAGWSEADATTAAARFLVAEGHGSSPGAWIDLVRSIDPRYIAIFDSRPVYPLVAAPLVSSAGTDALTIAAGLGAVLFAAALAALVGAEAGWLAALAAVVAAFALPTGGWFAHLFADGWMLALLTVCLATAAAYLRTQRRAWLGGFLVSLCALYLTKSANGAVLVAATAGVGLLAVARARRLGTAPARLAIAAAVVGAGLMLVFAWLHLPGLTETVQDLLTTHFARPDVADPWLPLLRMDRALLPLIVPGLLAQPLLVVVAGIGYAALLAVRAWWAGLVAVTGIATVLTVLVHPVPSEIPRLIAPIWIGVAIGWGILVAALVGSIAGRWSRHA